jgi:Amidase
MSSAEINYLTASDVLELFRTKKLSPVEYLRAVIAQCERVNPKVNAFTYTFFDRALKQAKAAEARYLNGDGVRPLDLRLEADAWERFERAVDVVAKSSPRHRKAKDSQSWTHFCP